MHLLLPCTYGCLVAYSFQLLETKDGDLDMSIDTSISFPVS